MLVKIIAIQAAMGQPLTLEEKIHIFKQRPDFICLPEYYALSGDVSDFKRAALRRQEYLEYIERLSDELSTCVVGGSVVEASGSRLYNTCYVYNRGTIVATYRKQNPVDGERRGGISAGEKDGALSVEGVRVGLLLCGDVFRSELYERLGESSVDIVFVPTTSPYRPDDSHSKRSGRDRKYFLDGARRAGSYVVKTCGVGKLFGKPLQGRSLICAPWGMLASVNGEDIDRRRLLVETVDIAELREFRGRVRRKTAKEWTAVS